MVETSTAIDDEDGDKYSIATKYIYLSTSVHMFCEHQINSIYTLYRVLLGFKKQIAGFLVHDSENLPHYIF